MTGAAAGQPAPARYLVALGSNVRHPRHGLPEAVVRGAVAALAAEGLDVLAVSRIVRSAPLGPSRRRYANGAVLLSSALPPPRLLAVLQRVEAAFGRRRRGSRWGARTLDLDIVLWSGGPWADADLVVPHRAFRTRPFVVAPAAAIAPHWRDPLTGLALRHLAQRLTRRIPARRGAA